MSDRAPREILSEHIQERLKGRRVLAAAFLTFKFEPGFFEQQVLPVILDVPVSHAEKVRVAQLEEALLKMKVDIAVYYDANGLVDGSTGSAKLDVRRIPVRLRTGIFHPKNVLLLVEDEPAEEKAERPRTLVVGCLSANLTRAGWWENIEACHFEEIAENDKSLLKGELTVFLESLIRRSDPQGDHRAAREILSFLRRVDSRERRSTDGRLHPQFYGGKVSLGEFLASAAGADIQNTYLEVISPYFDDTDDSTPLLDLIKRFSPKEVRVFLPRNAAGVVTCRQELYESVGDLDGVCWGSLSGKWLAMGSSADAAPRVVHAKVYRFFTQSPKREIVFVGSVNLTNSAHSGKGNLESGVLVDFTPPVKPDWWLTPLSKKATSFQPEGEDEGVAASGGSGLSLRYHWDTGVAEAYWDRAGASPMLSLNTRGVNLGELPTLASRQWTSLAADLAKEVASHLPETSFFHVIGEGDSPSLILVQEEGMTHKPSLLLQLSAADILRYWSLLTANQRAAFIEEHASTLALTGDGADLVTAIKWHEAHDTLFDRFAGVFHAFGCLERSISEALEEGREKEVDSRLFGKKYDSLGHLLQRLEKEKDGGDDVDRYVLVLCARQLVEWMPRAHPDFWSTRADQGKELRKQIVALASSQRERIAASSAEMPEFLSWFDEWFLRRAEPVVSEAAT